MKKMTIWQRLNTGMAFLVALLLVGVSLSWWIERTRSDAERRSRLLEGNNTHLHHDIVQMSDALRGLLLNPKSETDRKSHREAELDIPSTLDALESASADGPEIINVLNNFHEFVQHDLIPFHIRIMQMLDSDPAGAQIEYQKTFPAIRDRREQLFKDLTWQVARATKADDISAQTAAIVGSALIIVVLIATVIVGRFQSSALTEPLQRLVAALERMRQGDFTQRPKLDRPDEFGVVGDGLNRLVDDLSVLVGQVQRSGIQVGTTATEISASAKEQQSTANEIAATTAEIGATSKEISATARELVKTMNEVNQVAEETAQLANSGQAAIGRMEATMHQIRDGSGSITSKLAVLSEKTANINSVVTTITKVADQTNLLSLNAAIEAEKAGEYGLGFAMVAMEIRRLADQTAVATYDIEKMVKEMQSAVAAGVMGMDKFSEDVRLGVEEIRKVSAQLAQIIHQVQTLTPRFQLVNEGMHAQAAGAQQISETLIQLSDAAHQTAKSLRQSNLAIEQLNEAARGLQTSVARFKLEGQ